MQKAKKGRITHVRTLGGRVGSGGTVFQLFLGVRSSFGSDSKARVVAAAADDEEEEEEDDDDEEDEDASEGEAGVFEVRGLRGPDVCSEAAKEARHELPQNRPLPKVPS